MTEYINKAELMDEFYGALKVPVRDKEDKEIGWFAMSADYVYDITNNMPTIDIVTCGECVHNKYGECKRVPMGFDIACYDQWVETEDDFFCKYGERRIDG